MKKIIIFATKLLIFVVVGSLITYILLGTLNLLGTLGCKGRWPDLRNKYTLLGGCSVGVELMGETRFIPERNMIINFDLNKH
jgi:hypothetical protein